MNGSAKGAVITAIIHAHSKCNDLDQYYQREGLEVSNCHSSNRVQAYKWTEYRTEALCIARNREGHQIIEHSRSNKHQEQKS
jgi:hypothetical protein